jgi:hypothetical protein
MASATRFSGFAFAAMIAAASSAAFAAEVGPAPTRLRIEPRPAAPVRVAKAPGRIKRSPAPASPAIEETPVVETSAFDSTTSFEDLVKKSAGRDPASVKTKARVIALRRELGLTRASADQAPQDIVLSGGSDSGLEEGMTLKILRKVPVLDPYRDNRQLELDVPYGLVRIVHVQKDVAVARLEKMDGIQKGLSIGTRGVFVGDYVGSGD